MLRTMPYRKWLLEWIRRRDMPWVATLPLESHCLNKSRYHSIPCIRAVGCNFMCISLRNCHFVVQRDRMDRNQGVDR